MNEKKEKAIRKEARKVVQVSLPEFMRAFKEISNKQKFIDRCIFAWKVITKTL